MGETRLAYDPWVLSWFSLRSEYGGYGDYMTLDQKRVRGSSHWLCRFVRVFIRLFPGCVNRRREYNRTVFRQFFTGSRAEEVDPKTIQEKMKALKLEIEELSSVEAVCPCRSKAIVDDLAMLKRIQAVIDVSSMYFGLNETRQKEELSYLEFINSLLKLNSSWNEQQLAFLRKGKSITQGLSSGTERNPHIDAIKATPEQMKFAAIKRGSDCSVRTFDKSHCVYIRSLKPGDIIVADVRHDWVADMVAFEDEGSDVLCCRSGVGICMTAEHEFSNVIVGGSRCDDGMWTERFLKKPSTERLCNVKVLYQTDSRLKLEQYNSQGRTASVANTRWTRFQRAWVELRRKCFKYRYDEQAVQQVGGIEWYCAEQIVKSNRRVTTCSEWLWCRLGEMGVDLGKEQNVATVDILPADLERSGFFTDDPYKEYWENQEGLSVSTPT